MDVSRVNLLIVNTIPTGGAPAHQEHRWKKKDPGFVRFSLRRLQEKYFSRPLSTFLQKKIVSFVFQNLKINFRKSFNCKDNFIFSPP